MENLPPVVEEEERRHDVGAHLGEQRVVEQCAQRRHARDDHRDGGQQTARAAQVEALEVYAPRGGRLHQQELGDQKAREHEEHRDAQKAALRPGEPHVVGDHRQHGEGAQAVEGRHVLDAALMRCAWLGGVCLRSVPTCEFAGVFGICQGECFCGNAHAQRRARFGRF